MDENFYRDCLRAELDRRIQKNRAYSMRSFAKALQLEPGALSQVLSGKRVPSYKTAVRLLNGIDLSPADRSAFLSSLAKLQHSRGLKRMAPEFRSAEIDAPYPELSQEVYQVVGDWHHFAIVLLTETEGFRADPSWIAAQLGISVLEAKHAIERLLAVGLLENKGGKLGFRDQKLTTERKDLTTPALRRRQRQILEKAIDSLENDPIEVRSMTGLTMAIDTAQLPEAKKLISEFNRKMSRLLEQGRKSEVYELQISLFPLQKGRRK